MLSLIVLASALLGQAIGMQEFAGSWTADLRGESLARLDLAFRDGQLQGQLGLAGMHVDANGDVDALIPDAGHTSAIFDVALRDGVLSFSAKDEDDTDRFELRLVDGRAMLTLVVDAAFQAELAREGIAAPRPITLTRRSP